MRHQVESIIVWVFIYAVKRNNNKMASVNGVQWTPKHWPIHRRPIEIEQGDLKMCGKKRANAWKRRMSENAICTENDRQHELCQTFVAHLYAARESSVFVLMLTLNTTRACIQSLNIILLLWLLFFNCQCRVSIKYFSILCAFLRRFVVGASNICTINSWRDENENVNCTIVNGVST